MTPDFLLEMYRRILRIRYFDEAAVELVRQGELPGVAHTTIGQEAEVVGACMAVRVDDYMVGNHRSHGHPIGKGADMKRLMAELLGKVTGVNRGKGGSMHLADFSVGSVGETSIVGSGVPVAAGAALAARMLGTDRVCLCFFGDGATNEGAFHEGLNLAAIWKLPVIYLCENNQYAVTTPAAEVVAVRNIADRARAYDIPGVVVDGQDPVAVYEVVSEAVQRARQGLGPSLIEAKTYRYLEHAEGLPIAAQYRTAEEVAAWKARDPVVTFRQRLIQEGVATPEALDQVVAAVRAEVAEAVAYARSSPYPDPEEAFTGVYSTPVGGVR